MTEDEIGELEKELKATTSVKDPEHSAKVIYTSPYGTLYSGDPDYDEYIEVPDEGKRLRALERIIELYKPSRSERLKDLLERVYNHNYGDVKMRKTAGRALGYSRLRIWWNMF